MMSQQDNESEAEQKPPDSWSLRTGTSTDMNRENRGYKSASRGSGRWQYENEHENATAGYTEESLEESSQSCLFLLPQLLGCV
jgi:hypothetical protein